MQKKFYDTQFSNYGFLLVDLSSTDLYPIKEEVDQIKTKNFQADKANEYLIGHIEHEFKLTKCISSLEQTILPYIVEYENQYQYINNCFHVLSDNKPLKLQEPWVNFQKKFEFNPIHHHNGIYSFVLWLQIPYKIEDEINLPLCINSRTKCAGHFQFVYTNSLGRISTYEIPVDQTYENKMVIFPACMSHAVYPFYSSDDYRISISGNFIFDVN